MTYKVFLKFHVCLMIGEIWHIDRISSFFLKPLALAEINL